MSLKKKAVDGVKWTSVSTVITTILQLLQLAILGRLLDPSSFGLMSLVLIVIGFSQAFLDMGISNAIIHKQEISKNQLSTLYWVNVFSGFLLFICICFLSPFISSFYEKQELTKLIMTAALAFLIQPFGQQFMVLWQKEMRFKEIAKVAIINKSISLLVSVYFAYRGYGAYALVYGVLSGMVSQTIQFMYLGLKEYKPLFVFDLRDIKEFLSFGVYQLGEKIVNYFNSQLDILFIGKLLGIESLGVYTIAKQLIMRQTQIVNPIITKVTFPTMAKIQDDIPRLKNIYLKTINYLSSINFPIYAFIFIMAPYLIPIIFGDKWEESIRILQVLAIFGAIRSTGNPIGSLLLARGKANWGFYWNLGLSFYIPLVIYISSHWGLEGVSWGLVLAMLIGVVPNWYFLVRPLCAAKFLEYHKEIVVPMFIAMVAGVGSFLSIYFIDLLFWRLVVGGVIGGVFVFCLNYFFNRNFLIESKFFFTK